MVTTDTKISSHLFKHPAFRMDILKVAAFALTYFLAHRFAFLFPDSENVIMLIWPAAGIGLAAFLLNPRRLWPALTIAFYVAGILSDVIISKGSIVAGIGTMTASMIQSIGCAWFILYISPDFQKFKHVKEVLALLAGTILINAFTACIGAGVAWLVRGTPLTPSWLSWFISDGFGILLIGPFIVSWIGDVNESLLFLHSKKLYESLIFVIIWSIISYIIFFNSFSVFSHMLHPYMLVALLVWPALRLGMRTITISLIILFTIAVTGTFVANLNIPWGEANNDLNQILLQDQIFLMFLAFVGYLLSAFHFGLMRTESSLRKSEEKYRRIFENVQDVFYETSLDGTILELSPSVELFTKGRYKPTFLIGKSIWDFYFNSEDRILLLEELKKKGRVIDFEVILKDYDGLPIQCSVSAIFQFDISGQPERIIGSIRDISERKNTENAFKDSEKLLRETQEIAGLGSYVLDVKTGIWESSEILDNIFGIDETYICSLEGWTQLIHPEWREIMADYFSNYVLGKHKLFDKEYKIVRNNDGEVRWVHGMGKLEFDTADQPVKMIGTINDITWRKRIEEELNSKLNELQRFQKLTVGREINMIDLKKEVNDLLKKSGLKEKYKIFS